MCKYYTRKHGFEVTPLIDIGLKISSEQVVDSYFINNAYECITDLYNFKQILPLSLYDLSRIAVTKMVTYFYNAYPLHNREQWLENKLPNLLYKDVIDKRYISITLNFLLDRMDEVFAKHKGYYIKLKMV